MLVTQNDKSSTNKKENLVGTKSQKTPFDVNAWDEPLAALPPLRQKHVFVVSLPVSRQSLFASTDRPNACVLLAFLHHLMVSHCFTD